MPTPHKSCGGEETAAGRLAGSNFRGTREVGTGRSS